MGAKLHPAEVQEPVEGVGVWVPSIVSRPFSISLTRWKIYKWKLKSTFLVHGSWFTPWLDPWTCCWYCCWSWCTPGSLKSFSLNLKLSKTYNWTLKSTFCDTLKLIEEVLKPVVVNVISVCVHPEVLEPSSMN